MNATTEFFTVARVEGGYAVNDWTGAPVVAYRSKKIAEESARGYTLSLFGAAEAYDYRRTYVKAYLAARAGRPAPEASLQMGLF